MRYKWSIKYIVFYIAISFVLFQLKFKYFQCQHKKKYLNENPNNIL